MKKVAVFGNAGGGKSTLSKRLAKITNLPLIALDLLKYQPGGREIPDRDFIIAHDEILQQDRWIVDGFGSLDTVWKRLEVADTLIYIDLPVIQHYLWVTKRFLQGFWIAPENWPQDSPLIRGTLNSYYTVWLCHKKLTPKYREYVRTARETKQVFHLKSTKDLKQFLQSIEVKIANSI